MSRPLASMTQWGSFPSTAAQFTWPSSLIPPPKSAVRPRSGGDHGAGPGLATDLLNRAMAKDLPEFEINHRLGDLRAMVGDSLEVTRGVDEAKPGVDLLR